MHGFFKYTTPRLFKIRIIDAGSTFFQHGITMS